MNIFKIIGKGNKCHWVNLEAVILVEFDDEEQELIFDDILRIELKEKDFNKIRKKLLRKMFDPDFH